ncbi:MAG: diguanylate cyclase, partial [Nitrospirae bacterium]|nr:diguanylate cyclase [Nitrospirota bacterium]
TARHTFNLESKEVHLTVSVGVSTFPDDAMDREGLIKAADDALYMAKKMGRNRVVTFQQYQATRSH